MVLVGAFVTFGCEGIEQAKGISAGASLKVLPAHGLSGAEPLRAGLALGADRLAKCKAYEERRAREEKWPPITVPDQPVKLRSKPINARPKEVDSVVMKYNFNLDDNQQKGCFINAFQDNQDGTVTDYATKIMWKQSPSPAVTRSGSENFIRSLNEKKYAGYSDWRLPTIEEMGSIVEWHRYGKTSHIDLIVFKWNGDKYMTADTYEYDGYHLYWILDAYFRLVTISESKDEPAHIQAVRSL